MNIRDEIEQFAAEKDKIILKWLLTYYSRPPQWNFVAKVVHTQYGCIVHQLVRIWAPTREGRALYTVLKDEL